MKPRKSGTLYLIPTVIGHTEPALVLPGSVLHHMQLLDYFIVEQARTARRLLSQVLKDKPLNNLVFFELNKHTDLAVVPAFLDPARQGHDMGLMSEAGTPCIADPGNLVVSQAHEMGIKVVPLSGPNSIMMALMASGLNGQSFAFHGYLPISGAERTKAIRRIEDQARQSGQTQIFIETPFRNNKLFEALIHTCKATSKLCVAADITTHTEFIRTKTIADWQREKPDLHKRPCVFLLGT